MQKIGSSMKEVRCGEKAGDWDCPCCHYYTSKHSYSVLYTVHMYAMHGAGSRINFRLCVTGDVNGLISTTEFNFATFPFSFVSTAAAASIPHQDFFCLTLMLLLGLLVVRKFCCHIFI